MTTKNILFDLNGTIIDDMEFHVKAWHELLNNKMGKTIGWNEVKQQMYGNNAEVLERIFGGGKFSNEEILVLETEKEQSYQNAFFPHLKAVEGFKEFIDKLKNRNIKMAIASAAIPFNIDFILDGLNICSYFSAIVSAKDVLASKPHPETFLKAADMLHTTPVDCIVFEDAPKGVEAAARAGINCIVITTTHPKEDFEIFDNILFFIEDYNDQQLLQYFFT